MFNSLSTMLKSFQPEKKSAKNRPTKTGRFRFEQLESRMLLSVVSQAYDWNNVTIKGEGFVIRRGRHIGFLEAKIANEEGDLVATATSTVVMIHPE